MHQMPVAVRGSLGRHCSRQFLCEADGRRRFGYFQEAADASVKSLVGDARCSTVYRCLRLHELRDPLAPVQRWRRRREMLIESLQPKCGLAERVVGPGGSQRAILARRAEHHSLRQRRGPIDLRRRVDLQRPEPAPPVLDRCGNVEAHLAEFAKSRREVLSKSKALTIQIEDGLEVGVHRGVGQISMQRATPSQLRCIECLAYQRWESSQVRGDRRHRGHGPIRILELGRRPGHDDDVSVRAEVYAIRGKGAIDRSQH